MKVGFIGLGKMGAGICSNIVKNGIDVVVYDINPANMQKFADMGASSAATVKELAAQVDRVHHLCAHAQRRQGRSAWTRRRV